MTTSNNKQAGAIAVVGASALFPGSVGSSSFWHNILSGKDFIDDVPPDHWLVEDYYDPDPRAVGKVYAKRGGFLPKVDFDPMQYGVPPNQLGTTDTAQLLGLVVAQKLLEDAASVQFGKVDKRNISVILGVASATELVGQMAARIQRPHWVKALRDAGLPESKVQDVCLRIEATYPEWDESTFPGLLGNVVAGRIANRLDLGGTNCVVDAACASSLGAVAMAVQELQLGHSDLVITGGVDALNDIFMFMCFSKTPALSPSGDCRPFSEDADGTMLGEGIGMVALRRLEDAERDGDKIYAVIRGIGSASDGRSKSIYAPRAEGQEMAIRRAYEHAGYGQEQVGLIEAHGTATKAGDAAEFGGLVRAFAGVREGERQWCALGSIKSQIGHTKSAAGAASLFKAVMALHHKVLPPTIKVSKPGVKLEIESSPFYLNTETRPWIQPAGTTRKASVSSFGFGGSNFHVTLEEYPGSTSTARRFSGLPVHLLLVAAPTVPELLAKMHALRDMVDDEKLAQLARDSQMAFDVNAAHRLAMLAHDAAGAAADLEHAVDTIGRAPQQAFTLANRMHYRAGGARPKLAFLFPGQGSQYLNMGAALAIEFDAARRSWDELAAHDSAAGINDDAVHRIVFPVPVFSTEERTIQAARLTETDQAQPAIAATSLSMLRLLEQIGVRPDATGGHSFGEVTALHAAGAIATPESLLAVARKRGQLMKQAARTPGAMLALRCGASEAGELIARHGAHGVTIANVNSLNQVVVAGPTTLIENLQHALKGDHVASTRLAVATAFHTKLVADSVQPFRTFLDNVDVAAPRLPVYGNTAAEPYSVDPSAIRETLARQLSQPVRFADMVQRMYDDGCRLFVEVGPGSVLTAMLSDCLKGQDHAAVAFDNRKVDGRAAFMNLLGVLSSQGVSVDYAALWAQFAEVVLQTAKPSPATVKLNGANYGKPYPGPEGSAAVPRPNLEQPTPVVNSLAAASPVSATASLATNSFSSSPAPKLPVQRLMIPTPMNAEWAAAFQALQQNTFDAHKTFTATLADSHHAFLRASETAFQQLGQLVQPGGMPQAGMDNQAAPAWQAPVSPDLPPGLPPVIDRPNAPPMVMPVAERKTTTGIVPAAAVAGIRDSLASQDHKTLLLKVVSEKTGYPVDMLTLDMELEGGLGIDSIKRVEILAALQQEIPSLAGVATAELAALNTLGDIVAFSAGTAGAAVQPSVPARVALPTPTLERTPTGVDHQALLLDVVADKTGYPASMLTLDMELEAGLGIDSIKRVEILAALQERMPQLADIDTGRLAALNTLGEILAFAQTPSTSDSASTAAAPTAPAPAPVIDTVPSAPASDYQTILLQVVADKTGYPESMLTLDMELEAGLGIDSIKRVEILAALQQSIPQLADVDSARLAALNTLGEILAFATEATSAPLAAIAPEQTDPVVPVSLDRLVVDISATPAPGMVTPGLMQSSPLYVVGSTHGIAPLLAAALAEAGVDARVVDEPPADARSVVLMQALDARDSASAQVALNEAALLFLQACADSMATDGNLLVTVQDTGGAFGMDGKGGERTWSAGIAALAKTAALEWPHVSVKAIDVSAASRTPADVARALAVELLAGGAQLEVGLTLDGARVAPVLRHEDAGTAQEENTAIAHDGVIVVSGGARGVTAVCIEALAARLPGAKFAILGRTVLSDEPAGLAAFSSDAELKQELLARHKAAGEMPTPQQLGVMVRDVLAQRELRANLGRFESNGAKVRYFTVDVADADAVTAALSEIRAGFGPVCALIHAAGVIADKEIRSKTAQQFRQVFQTKVTGLQNLLDATCDDTLTRIVCFSSVAAWRGNVGQVDYAMANEVLNRVCVHERARRGVACLVKAIGWGPWAGGMVDASLEKHFGAMGMALIPLVNGAQFFADEFTGRNGTATTLLYGGDVARFAAARNARDAATFDLRFHRTTHSWLASHVIRGTPVVPLVLVNDLALHAVQTMAPGEIAATCVDLSVIKGIRLPRFDGAGDRFRIECQRTEARDVVAVRVVDSVGMLHYTVNVLLGHPDRMAASNGLALDSWQPASGAIYDGRLFHGTDLHVIATLDGISGNACAGTLQSRASHPLGRAAPVDLLDGGLQLASLWMHEKTGRESLPTRFRRFRSYLPWLHGEAVRCDALCTLRSSLMAQWTLHWRNPAGELLASMEGVDFHLLPEAQLSKSDLALADAAAK